MIDLDCASCGLAFNAARLDGLVYEDDEEEAWLTVQMR